MSFAKNKKDIKIMSLEQRETLRFLRVASQECLFYLPIDLGLLCVLPDFTAFLQGLLSGRTLQS